MASIKNIIRGIIRKFNGEEKRRQAFIEECKALNNKLRVLCSEEEYEKIQDKLAYCAPEAYLPRLRAEVAARRA